MPAKIRGFRGKSRKKLTKHHRQKGKISLSKYFTVYNNGDKVALCAEPAVQHGMYYPKFHGKIGVVKGKRGSCYHVLITDKNKEKTVLVHPVHLKAIQR